MQGVCHWIILLFEEEDTQSSGTAMRGDGATRARGEDFFKRMEIFDQIHRHGEDFVGHTRMGHKDTGSVDVVTAFESAADVVGNRAFHAAAVFFAPFFDRLSSSIFPSLPPNIMSTNNIILRCPYLRFTLFQKTDISLLLALLQRFKPCGKRCGKCV